MPRITMFDRYLGAMVGTLCGDAMGAPVEWWDPEKVAAYFDKVGGYRFHDYYNPWSAKLKKPLKIIHAGQPTDDSELTAALATSLVERRGLESDDLYERLRSFIHGRKSILTDKAFGSGGTLRAALSYETYAESEARFLNGDIPTPPTNGSLMRCVPIPLRYRSVSFGELIDRARQQSWVTHQNPESVAACMLYTLWVALVLSGMSIAEAWRFATNLLPLIEKDGLDSFESVLAIEPTKPEYKTEIEGKEGHPALSLRVAVWAAVHAKDYRSGIINAISVGGDTDTYAAIAGGVLGAHFGIDGIPQEWRESVQGYEIMQSLGARLYELARN
jgi:ADP-ribosyl-[dinitrogen reductase] hydrolase